MGRLLIVSNRLPFTAEPTEDDVVIRPSSGGLATGLSGPHKTTGGLWIGWPGDLSSVRPALKQTLQARYREAGTVPVGLSKAQIRGFYDGFSNGVLWPLFHQLANVDRDASRNWKTYQEVNRIFAEAVIEHYQPGDTIWVHDYQLCLVPGILRERLPDARIGFFLHIPFPSSESFRILPWRAALLRGMLGADLIGFHTQAYRRHFHRALLLVLGLLVEEDGVVCDGRRVQLGVFPMGIDATRFARDAQTPEIQAAVEAMRSEGGEQRMLLGVDRLDYTKGIGRRIVAIDRLLERFPEWREKVRLVQVIVPSRATVASYERLRRELDELVGRINGRHATQNWVPIHNIFRSLTREELIGLYASCDAMLVTPLRDGMNLVAKEFLATRAHEDGALILSEFAGAAAELTEAVLVNPYDVDGVAEAIDRALKMSGEEQQRRMKRLRARVFGYDVYRWTDKFLTDLESASLSRTPSSGEESLRPLVEAARAASRLVLLLDYDGTLVPFASEPELARPDEELLALLSHVAHSDGVEVHVVSGRSAQSLEHWLGHLPIHLHAEHGFWSCRAGSGAWVPLSVPGAPWKNDVRGVMDRYVTETRGSRVEEKDSSLAWHYRNADVELGATQAQRLSSELEPELSTSGLEVLSGARVVEVRVKGTHKGVVPPRVCDMSEQVCVIAMGDDRTDEDLFAALPPNGFAVHVGPGLSRAAIRIPDVASARRLLAGLAAARPARTL
jgi:trehalose 6-phosphate synthase/phosphatase